jgi:hypothetical protein
MTITSAPVFLPLPSEPNLTRWDKWLDTTELATTEGKLIRSLNRWSSLDYSRLSRFGGNIWHIYRPDAPSGPVTLNITTALFWNLRQRTVLIPFRRFRTTYRSHLQGSRISRRKLLFLDHFTTSVRNYHSTLRQIPEERRSRLHRGRSLQSRK